MVATAALAAFASAGIAYASWSTTNTGSGTSQAVAVTAPGAPTLNGTATSSSIPVQWTAGSVGGATVKYWVQRADFGGSTYSDACGSSQATPITGTSCTDTGLASPHDYQYQVTVIAGNWQKTGAVSGKLSTAASAQTVSASLLASATDITGSSSTTVTGVSGTAGKTLLIMVYRDASASGITLSSVTGTAIAGSPAPAPSAIASQAFTNNAKTAVFAWKATASGTSNGTVVVNFSDNKNNKTVVDVVQLSGNDTSNVIAHSVTAFDASANTTASATISNASSANGEIFFVGVPNGSATSMSTPSGFTGLDAPATTGTNGLWFKAAAQTTAVSTTLGASRDWGAIALELSHG